MVALAPTSLNNGRPTSTSITTAKSKKMAMPVSSSPVPSILKKSAGRKRKMDEMASSSPSPDAASDSAGEESKPKKKARVQFEPDVEIRLLDRDGNTTSGNEWEKSANVVNEEVRRAIQRHVMMGDSEGYDRVKELFLMDPKKTEEDGSPLYASLSPASLKNHLMSLLANVSSLNRSCNGLVHAVIGSEWLGREDRYVKLFIRFLANLAAAHGGYLGTILKMLVNNFREAPKGTGRLPGYSIVSMSEIYDRIHLALRYILQLIPAGSGTLSPILSMQFPFETDSAKENISYTRNLLKIIQYAPELQSDILALITEKLVKIDVQIQVDMEDFEDEVGEDLVDDAASPENIALRGEDDEDSDAESVASDESVEDIDVKRLKTVKGNIQKMDCMIDLMFEFYSRPFNSNSVEDQENALDMLLSHFESIILPTYRSRHTQFLLFHYSQISPMLVDRFATACIQMIFDKRHPAIMRQSAAAYLASFVARGAHVSAEVVGDVFDLLGTHLSNLRTEYENDTCRGPDLRRYGPFYSTAQALLYIFCFRWRDLTTTALGDDHEDPDDFDLEEVSFPQSIKDVLQRAIYCKLNPLKVCSPAIVTEFARIAHHLKFMYVYPLLETNKRLRMTSFRSMSHLASTHYSQVERETRAGEDNQYQLDAYFPFDPYHLPRSKRWLEGDYVEWRGIPGLDDDRDEDTDSEEDEDEENELEVTGTDSEDSE